MERIGQYEIKGRIASGAVGSVLLAYDPQLRRNVALKVMLAGPDASEVARKRFLLEGRPTVAYRILSASGRGESAASALERELSRGLETVQGRLIRWLGESSAATAR